MSKSSGRRQLPLVIGVALVFSVVGWLLCYGSLRLGIIGECYQLRYAAQEELIALEKARIKKEGAARVAKEKDGAEKKEEEEGEEAADDGGLFFGEIETAVRLAAEIAYRHETGNTKVILSSAPIYAKGVVSISKEVHEEVIAELKRQKGRRKE